MSCPACGTHGAWAAGDGVARRFCRCGKLGGPPPEVPGRIRLVYRYLVEPVESPALTAPVSEVHAPPP